MGNNQCGRPEEAGRRLWGFSRWPVGVKITGTVVDER
jgi:hypothetical protein